MSSDQNETTQISVRKYLQISHLNSNHPTYINTMNQNTNTPLSPQRSSNLSKSILEYKPKRKIKVAPLTKIPLSSLGRGSMNFDTFITNTKVEESKINKNDIEFRTAYILKYAQNAENFYKTKKYFDYISEGKKGYFNELHSKIKKLIENQNNVLFDQISNLNKTVITLCCEYNNLMNKY